MRLSIVICAYNEEKSIGSLLKNLDGQRLPPEIVDREIIVVASGCTDKTVDIVEQYMTGDAKIRLVEEETRLGKASALNRAFKISSGDYVALIPADVYPADDALFNLLVPFRDKRVSAVSGRPVQSIWKTSKGFAGCMAQITYRLWGKLMEKLNDKGQMAHCSGEFMAIRSNVKTFIPIGCAADDSYIAILARKRGVVRFASNAICYNLVPSNIVDYVNQRRRWLFGHFQTKVITGEYPTVMDTMVLSRPGVAFQVLAEEISERPKEIGYLVSSIVVEAAIYMLSVIDHVFHRQRGVWPVIRSTKYA